MQGNQKYTALIVDDNKVARALLIQILGKIGSITIVGECESGQQAQEFLNKNEVDLLFLDVEMPGMSGIELLQILQNRPLTILATAQQGYAVQAFELNVVDYLVKPFSLQRINVAVQRAIELLNSRNVQLAAPDMDDAIFIKENKIIRKINVQDILWLESKGDYVSISTADKSFILHGSLKSFDDKLPEKKFIRVHRSFIIPVNKIDYIEDKLVYIHNRPIPVSESYRQDLLKKLGLA